MSSVGDEMCLMQTPLPRVLMDMIPVSSAVIHT
jgi:hypothetical protein